MTARSAWWLGVVGAVGVLAGCGRRSPEPTGPGGTEAGTLTVRSTAFPAGKAIPPKHTADGEDVSPALSWAGLPAETKELAMICDDPDAPRAQAWVHWVIYKIPADANALPEGVAQTDAPAAPAGAMQGKNDFGHVGYGGPAPPRGHGVHHYHFTLYALDAALDLQPGLTKKQLLAAMEGHVLAEGEVVGTYQR